MVMVRVRVTVRVILTEEWSDELRNRSYASGRDSYFRSSCILAEFARREVSHPTDFIKRVREQIKREESGPIANWNDSLRKDSCGHWRVDLAKLCDMVEERDAEIARLRAQIADLIEHLPHVKLKERE